MEPQPNESRPLSIGADLASFQSRLAERMTEAGNELARRWLDRVVALNVVDPEHVFPTRELLDHIPELIAGIAASLRPVSDGGVEVASNPAIMAKARQLGQLRHTLGFSLQGVLKEYEVLGAILVHFLGEESRALDLDRRAVPAAFDMARRLHLALSTVLQATVDTYVDEYLDGISRFERALGDQLRRPLAAAQGASELLAAGDSPLPPIERERLQKTIRSSLAGMERSMQELVEFSAARFRRTLDRQRLRISDVVTDVRKQLRETAAARDVRIYIVTPMPELDVDAAGLEAVLEVLLSNAIRFSDPAKPERHVSVGCVLTEDDGWVLYVRDNGIGMTADEQRAALRPPPDAPGSPGAARELPTLTEAAAPSASGATAGLGLWLARQVVERWGGRLWVESAPKLGSIFFLSLPTPRGA
jgi:signal transduction histidine kinase